MLPGIKKILRLLILFLISAPLFGQEPEMFRIPCQYKVGWVADGTSYDKNTNEIIREISFSAVKGLNKTALILDFTIGYTVRPAEENQSLVQIFLGTPSVRGDKFIRGFDQSVKLRPDKVFITFYQRRKADSLVIKSQEWKNIFWCSPDSATTSVLIRDYDKMNDTLIITVDRIAYSEDAFNAFIEQIKLVNDYYACSAILDSLQILSGKSRIGDVNNLPRNLVWVEEFYKVIQEMGKKNFDEHLDLEQYDPANYRLRYRELFRLSKSTAMTFRQKLDSSVLIEPPYPLSLSVKEFVNSMLRYIRWSLLVNSRNGRIYEDYLNTFFISRVYEDNYDVLKEMLTKIYPAENTDSSYNRLCEILCNAYEQAADSLMSGYQYAEASLLMDNEEQFIRFSGYRSGNHDHSVLKIKASNGIYDSYLGVAETSMNNGKFQMAENYLGKAQEYRKKKYGFITIDSLLQIVSRRLVGLKLAQCDTLAVHEHFDEAIACYHNLNLEYDSLTSLIFREEINLKTARCLFAKYRNIGLVYFEKNNLPDAGKYFHMAESIRTGNNLPADFQLDSLFNVVYPWYLVSILRAKEDLVWTNQLGKATHFADSVSSLAIATGHQNQPDFTAQLARYRRKIQEKTCYNATEKFEVLVLRGERNLEMGNFIKGTLLLDSALVLSKQQPECRLPMDGLADTIMKYDDPALFQKKLITSTNLVSINDYKNAVAAYLEADRFYQERKLDRFGLQCQALYDFARQRSIAGLTLESTVHFLSAARYSEAFRFLVLLRLQDYPSKETRKIQETLGRELASADFPGGNGKDPGTSLARYTPEDKWFSRFRMSYLYQWNILKNEKTKTLEN